MKNAKQYLINDVFEYKNSEYKIICVGFNRITCKPIIQPSPVNLCLTPEQFTVITGGFVETESKDQYMNRVQDEDLIRKLNAIKYNNGQTAKEVYDEYMANGYNKIAIIKVGAVNKYYLENTQTNGMVPISGICRTYVTKVLNALNN